ncbi:MAG: single-stranded DNA-binding protein [Bacteroidota bacterium]
MINKVILLGNVGKDPDINYIQPDVPLAKFPLATDESFKRQDGEWEKRTEWHNVVAWRNTAKYVENRIKKGMQVYVEGKIQTRKYEDQNGQEKYITQIVAQVLRISNKRGLDDDYQQNQQTPADTSADTGKKPDNTPQDQGQDTNEDPFGGENNENDDLPF